MITIEEFRKLDLRVAKVLEAKPHPNADRLLVVKVDIGGGETREIVAGIKPFYAPESLVGKSVIVIVNLQPATLRGVESQGMVLATSVSTPTTTDAPPMLSDLALLVPEKPLPPGSKVS